MGESSEQIRNSDGNPAIQSTKSRINDTISASSPILRLTGDPGEHERFQEGNGNGLRMSCVVHVLFSRTPGAETFKSITFFSWSRQAEIRVWGAILLHPHQPCTRTPKAALW